MNPDSHKDPDNYQQAWQAHSSQTRVTIDIDLLQKEVQRNQRDFRAIIFRRDFIEVAVALLLIPYWFYAGITHSLPWTWYLTVPVLVWLAGFMLVYRARHKQKPNQQDEPLLQCVQRSLKEVESQVWLLRNVFWWYLLPPSISILAFFADVSFSNAKDWLDALSFAPLCVVLVALYYFIYRLNQRAVDSDLEPRRQELLALIASLGDESTGEFAATSRAESVSSPTNLGRWPFIAAASCLVAIVMIVMASRLFDSSYDGSAQSIGPAGDSLAGLITDLSKEKNLVGLAAMVMVDGQVEAAAAQGERKKGSGVPLEIGDRWHLGGVTKSMTATMIARLIESGQMNWSDTVGQSFPGASMHEDWESVTLKQLLTHTAGAPANFSIDVSRNRPPYGPECTKARREAVLDVIANQPLYTPGERHAYSSVGFTIAGAMVEQATGAAWMELMNREVFEPLELTGAGFGPPKSSDETLQQPRGHRTFLRGKVVVDDEADNTSIIGPAATVHMTLHDLCTFATEHLRGDLGKGKLLSAETYELLHTPELNRYACGWIRKEPDDEIPYTVYWHNGTNTFWYALVVFIPEKNIVVAVTSNDGDFENAELAAWEIVKASVKRIDAPRRGLTQGTGYPQASPFIGVRWQDSQPEVRLGAKWLKLVSLDELPAAEIVAFSRRTYGDKWRMRFEEDLVELLTGMGHPPQDSVTLVVQSLTSSETSVREDVPMTYENRRTIQNAADTRVIAERQRARRAAVSIEETELFRQRVDEFLQLARVETGFSGVVAVARGGQTVYQGSVGYSQLASRTPNTLDTPFRIASLSKQFTAAAILSLEADGNLSVDDPVSFYLPEFAAEPYREITIYHLLTHTSGLPRNPEDAARHARWDAMAEAPTPVSDYVRLACECPLQFEPGQGRVYSNFGYRVLSAIIEQVSGADYADFMEQRLFKPLGLGQSGVARISQPSDEERVAEVVSLEARNRYSRQPSFVTTDNSRNYGAGYGSGGIYASVNDLLRWDRVLAGDSFLSAEQKVKLFRPFREDYACGWVVKKFALDGRLYQTHSGANQGYFSQMMRIPEDDLVIIALGNTRATDKIDDALEQLFLLCRSLPYQDL
jgi:CubicO group peptidase (beta-lactamase class C family)